MHDVEGSALEFCLCSLDILHADLQELTKLIIIILSQINQIYTHRPPPIPQRPKLWPLKGPSLFCKQSRIIIGWFEFIKFSSIFYMQNCMTPGKGTSTPLKAAILDRVSSKKKKVQEMPTSAKTAIEQSKYQEPQLTPPQEIILSYQNSTSPGFFAFADWLAFAEQNLKAPKTIVEDLWKIMRMMNFGEVLIPSGLVHDVYVDLSGAEDKGGLEFIFNQFLKTNEIADTVRGFKDLQNYTDLQTIEKHFKGNKFGNPKQSLNQSLNQSLKSSPSLKKGKDVWTRVHEEARSRTNKKLGLVCSEIVRQMSECKFKPEIHKYKTNEDKVRRPERICHHKQFWKGKNEEEVEPITELLKAKKIDRTLFEVDIQQIPGVVEHLHRNTYCEAERQKLKRQLQRPVYSGKKKRQ